MKKLALFFLVALAAATFTLVSCKPQKTCTPGATFKLPTLNLQYPNLGRRSAENEVYKLPVPANANMKGAAANEALVTVIEFSDFQCPYCSQIGEPLIKAASDPAYQSKVRVIFRHFPLSFHKNAAPVSLASLAVKKLEGPEKFFKFHDIVFAAQKDWSSLQGDDLAKKIMEYVCQAQIDQEAFKKIMENPPAEMVAELQNDINDAAKFGINGTPSIFVNGKLYRGGRTVEGFKQAFDNEIKANESLKGKPDVYAEIVKNGKEEAAPPPPPEFEKQVYKVEIQKEFAPPKGAKEPKITMIEFSDFQCPYCKRGYDIIEQVLAAYPNDVAVYFAQFPLNFHKNAEPSAIATIAAGEQGKFWEMYSVLFTKQAEWSSLAGDELTAKFVDFAGQAGVKDINKFKTSMNNPKHKESVKKQMEYGSNFGVQGTPTIFLNGRKAVGAYPMESFKKAIDEELARANELLGTGVKPKDLYAALIKDGKEKAEKPAGGQQGESKTYNFKPEDLKNSPMKGDKNAKVTIVQFSDFQCPFCGRVEPTIDKIMEEYKGKVKVYWLHMPLPFHKLAPIASIATMAAGDQGKFWQMHKHLFENQKDWSGLADEESAKKKFVEFAKTLGLNEKKFEQALSAADAYKAQIKQDTDLFNKATAGNGGTPNFFINGKQLVGAQPYEKFKEAVEEALKGGAADKKDGKKK